jgi:hypothetical protein
MTPTTAATAIAVRLAEATSSTQLAPLVSLAVPESARCFALARSTKPCLFLATIEARTAYGADFQGTPFVASPEATRIQSC